MPARPTRKAALEAKRKLKENAPGDSEQAVVVAPKPAAQRRPVPSKPEEPEKPTTRRTRQAAAQAARRPSAQAPAPAPAAQARAEPAEWAELPAAALDQQDRLLEPGEDGPMRDKEDGDEKAGPSGKKDAAEDEASTAPLPEKVHAPLDAWGLQCRISSASGRAVARDVSLFVTRSEADSAPDGDSVSRTPALLEQLEREMSKQFIRMCVATLKMCVSGCSVR